MSTFASLLRHHREAKRWSMERLASASALDHSLISRLERDERNPTCHSITQLVGVLGLSEAQQDALWIAAGIIPPGLDTNLLGRLIAIVREANPANQRAA